MKHIVVALCLLATSAVAQVAPVETVTVIADSLAGMWEVLGPPPQHAGDLQFKLHCRIEHALSAPSVYCFERKAGSLTVSNGMLRIVWTPTLIDSNVLEGKLTSADSFTASEWARKFGITLLKRDRLTGTRLMPDPETADSAGKASLLGKILEEQANGESGVVRGGALVELPDAASLRALGALTAISYIDRAQAVIDDKIVPDFFNLYEVGFQNGHRLCGLHQRNDSVINALRCV